ncbi:non-specific lipid transfer protein GPI-anchored 26 [Cicer arietinum]|uniref:Non-specific lipid-transfer protein-like protein At2g13820 n=1 Tax=Cicer arietinum TaxID=3827 RepID=A0A1S2YX81_CICAR|nr:non-specific lipid-transfer protein-like protein At2g13820 [Cicer arietinum]
MAHRKMMGLVFVIMAMLCAGAAAQSSCTNVLITLSPCLNYITGNSSTPSSGCCSQLSSVVRSTPQCLCQVLGGGGSSLGININQTQALALPGACKVQTPPTSQCNKSSSPANSAASPANSPTGTEAESPNSVPSGSGSKSTPTAGDGSSNGNSIKLSIPLFLILAATYASVI